ncbi:TPA: 50S ribosomal protein L11 [Candidatus Woesearchaeota archaeon]|nr:50S ribosomal protein L11 [Candidatus Woesearchaeota archaeon]HIH47200.1 50S ribosomal protein L11 [Candidatus Woesearchaeota archaeon]HII88903.1 50S ribosomal protein L11 [Candidatus Woesearchaeota archaeon]
MATETVNVQVEGGKATAAPPLGPALGPLGVNIGQVISEINKKTADFKGMKVPVAVTVDKSDKSFTISIGTPPSSQLIKKEAGIEKGAANPLLDKLADLKIEQIIKISKMKQDSLLGKDNFAKVKEICGTCDSMGILVEGKQARETIKDINNGMYKDKILAGKSELSAEELKALEQEKIRLAEELEHRRKEFENRAKAIIKEMEGKPASQIKSKMREEKIPDQLIKELLPAEEKAAPGAGGKPGAPAGAKPGAKAGAPAKK